MLDMYALYACLICLICMPYMHALCVQERPRMASHLVREGDSAEGARIHERLVSLRGAAAGRDTRKSVYTALIIVKRYHTDFSEFV